VSELSGRVRGVVNTPTVSSASGRWSVRAVAKYVAENVWPSLPRLGGDFEPLAVITVPSGGLATIDFNAIPQTFQHLQVRGVVRSSQAAVDDVSGFVRMNGDTGNNYARHRMYGYGTSVGADNATSANFAVFGTVFANNNLASCFSGVVCDIVDYSNTSKNKTVRSLAGAEDNSRGNVYMTSGLWMSTAAITSLSFSCSSGNFVQHSTLALYGARAL
jgi:hypothetical protein